MIILWFISHFVFLFESADTQYVLHSQHTTHELKIDGDLGDWKGGSAISISDRVLSQGEHVRVLSDNVFTCQSQWDQSYLYFALSVKDEYLNAHQTQRDHQKLFLDDMIEVLLDPINDGGSLWLPDDMVYHINLLNAIKDDRGVPGGGKDVSWNGEALTAVAIDGSLNNNEDLDMGYTVEVAIPWSEIDVTPRKGMELGFNCANGDNDNKGRQLFDWVGAWPLRSPGQFGKLIIN